MTAKLAPTKVGMVRARSRRPRAPTSMTGVQSKKPRWAEKRTSTKWGDVQSMKPSPWGIVNQCP
jgi:hypothetical protein